MDSNDGTDLCLDCGLCCNGVIFARGELIPTDDSERLRSLGLSIVDGKVLKFKQPCAAHDGCRCRIYSERPAYCRQFNCRLLEDFRGDKIPRADALKTIRAARKRVDKVRRLLHALGDTDESSALSLRFRRMQKRVESTNVDASAAALFGELTLAMHDLNRILNKSFIPGPDPIARE